MYWPLQVSTVHGTKGKPQLGYYSRGILETSMGYCISTCEASRIHFSLQTQRGHGVTFSLCRGAGLGDAETRGSGERSRHRRTPSAASRQRTPHRRNPAGSREENGEVFFTGEQENGEVVGFGWDVASMWAQTFWAVNLGPNCPPHDLPLQQHVSVCPFLKKKKNVSACMSP